MSGHLYVHIPFCRSRCAYCDFASEPIGAHARAGRLETYVERLRAELRERTDSSGTPAFDTIYVGGGTPTSLPEELLLPLVSELAGMQGGVNDREFTIEVNPGTADARSLATLVDAGITRVSLGIQSFSPRARSVLGRRCEQADIERALHDLRAAAGGGARSGAPGLGGWNADLVFGIPGQSWEEAAADIDAAVAFGPTHVSLYDLSYTPTFAARVASSEGAGAQRAAGAFAEEHLASATARLEAAGYRRYEVSNFALPGHECRHNLAYWRGEDYLGIGAAAVSTEGLERRTNPATVVGYIGGEPPLVESLSPGTRLWETAMLGLRTAEGVLEAEVLPVLDSGTLARLVSQEYVHRGCGRLRLNPAFLDVSNTVISALLAAPEES